MGFPLLQERPWPRCGAVPDGVLVFMRPTRRRGRRLWTRGGAVAGNKYMESIQEKAEKFLVFYSTVDPIGEIEESI